MRTRSLTLAVALCALALPAAHAARAIADVLPPQRRQATVDTAERLAQRTPPAPLPEELRSPFNPPGFVPAPAPRRASSAPAAVAAQPAGPATDRETLETLAAQIKPSGYFNVGGKPLLLVAGRRFEIGTRFIASYNDQDYELELVAIEPPNFTLRYRDEEIVRPIRSR